MNQALIPAAKLALCRRWPYAATAVMSVKPIERPGMGTAAIDKNLRMYYDPEFLDKLYDEQGLDGVVGLLAHEVAHPMLRHHKRADRVNDPYDRSWQARWNIAADLSINGMLRAEGITLPDGALFAEKHGFEDQLSAEQYYNLLMQQAEQQDEPGDDSGPESDSEGGDEQGDSDGDPDGQGEGDGEPGDEAGDSGQPGDGEPGEGDAEGEGDGQPSPGQAPGGSGSDGVRRDWEDPEPGEGEPDGGLTEHEVETVARKCAEAAKACGSASAGMSREADGILEPTFDPRRLLMHAVRSCITGATSGSGYSSYRRPSRRQPIGGVLRPKTLTPDPRVAVIVDTSGSMSPRELGECLGLIGKVLRCIGNSGVEVISGDTKACSETHAFHPSQLQSIKLDGGGGTDMAAIIDEVADRKQRPDLILVATDGGTSWPDKKPPMPVVCCLTSDQFLFCEPPGWMQVVKMQ